MDRRLCVALICLFSAAGPMAAAQPRGMEALLQLLQTRHCSGCRLADADLVHADLRDAQLDGAQLQRANLGQARLDGADLRGADLSFTSLRGASLQGADLSGAKLFGSDLREADLSGAILDQDGLSSSHWNLATGIDPSSLSYAELHNAGAEAAQQGRFSKAEEFFSQAILRQPKAAISWVARGISRGEQGDHALAAQDLAYAGRLYADIGNQLVAEQLQQASVALTKDVSAGGGGNGLGSSILSGAISAVQMLVPLAAKAFMPLGL